MKKRILVVEDEELCREQMGELFKELGYDPLIPGRSDLALRFINFGGKYDLALVDLSLPEVPGDEIIRASKLVNPDTPVIAMSVYQAERCERLGADGYLEKSKLSSFNEILLSKIEQLLTQDVGTSRR